jgi:putative RNA 2'-phosphotransferase
MDPALIHLSKFISLVLRHQPERIGLNLDPNGWADVDELLQKADRFGFHFDHSTLEQVVAENDKKRFAFSPDGTKIRASQGHSIQVDLELEPVSPPEVLYHGTASRFQASILAKGLLPGSRQHVHLSKDLETALKVGSRHGKPVIFLVKAREMEQAGLKFYLSANHVWLTAHVPVQYLQLSDNQEVTRNQE